MKITISIEVADLAELEQIQTALAGTEVSTEVVEKPVRKKTTAKKPDTGKPVAKKRETAAQKKKRLAAEAEAELMGEDEPTRADVHTAMKAYIQANSVPAAKKVMAEYGASKLSELGEEHYAQIIEDFAV